MPRALPLLLCAAALAAEVGLPSIPPSAVGWDCGDTDPASARPTSASSLDCLDAYERQHGVCPLCGARFELAQMEADHITPWRDGGRTVPANGQMLCKDCNRRKGAK